MTVYAHVCVTTEVPCLTCQAEMHRAALPAHRALVWFLSGVPSHMHHQHVLSLERLLFPCAVLPAADKLLLLPVDVIIVDVLVGEKGELGHSWKS